ncbi:MAG: glycosyltransferase [Acetobacteraceae bacterium]|nr:glycosyltransferase [Acetobacteraceae bacterium]
MDLPTRPDGPSPEDLLARADSLRDGKAWADAAELYADYLRCRPEHWQIWVQYGHCTKECGDAETALLLYREAERLRPEEADIHLHLGHALKLLGRADEAAEAYARALSLDPANDAARGELLAVAGAAQPGGESPGPAVDAAPVSASACVFDASDLLDYAKRNRAPTGIQRVQLNLIERSLGLGGAVAAFDTASGAWKPVPRAAFERLAALSRSGADPDDPDWKDAVSALSDAVRRGPQLEFAPGGMLVTLGTAWWIPNYLLRVREAKARHGLRYVPMVYDCIPVVRPEDCAEGLCAEFAAWFAGACVHADAMLAISDCTRDDVLRLRRGLLPGAEDIPVAVLPLHAGPLLPEPAAAPASPRRRPYVLFVATVEARKNHLMVFNAWLSLIRRHGADAAPDLVCVGKRGWKADEAFALLAGSRALRERVFLLHDVSDAELDALYRGCLCTVFNSRYEGWGLPVTESIGYGKVPIVADNSSLRQAGGEAALFFASGSEPELVARLEAMVFDADFRAAQEAKVGEAPPLRRWDELAADLAAALAAVPAVPTPPLARLARFFRAGADYAVRALPGSDPTLEMAIADAVREGPCWGRLKEWGVRALRGCAVLRLPGAALHGTARITLQMQGPPGGGRFGLRAGPAGAVDGPFRWIEATDHERLFCVLEVPDAAGRELVVEVDTPEGSRLEDGRLVGPNLLGFMVCAADDFAARLGYLERKALAKLIAV